MLIYMATNRINGKEYVGQTACELRKRKRDHISLALRNNRDDNMYFHKTIRKHGPENFDFEILQDDITNINDLNRLEIHYIKLYDTFNNGYNLTEGGNGSIGFKHSEETRERMVLAHKNRNPISDGTRKKMCKAQGGKNHPNYGKFGKSSARTKRVLVENIYFDTLKESAEFLKLTSNAVIHRIKHKTKWLEYSYAT